MRRRCGVLALAAALLLPAGLNAQWFDAQFPRRGELQVGLTGQSITVDRRFTLDGSLQPLTEMYTAVLDSRLVPPLDSLDLTLIDLFPTLGLADPEASTLGPLRYDVVFERTRAPITISFAPTGWLAFFTVVPLVKGVGQRGEQLDTLAANSGSLASAFDGNPDAFFAGLGAGIAALESMVAADTLPPDLQTEAQALLVEARAIETGLLNLNELSYVPTDSGSNGTALSGFYDTVRSGFEGFAVALPALALARPIDEETAKLLSSGPEFGIEAPEPRSSGVRFGDIEVGISLQPFNTFRRREDGTRPIFPLRARFDALWRFATGTPPLAQHLFDVGTGDGQSDLELRGTFEVGLGSRLWLSVFAGYNIQLEGEVERLVTSRELPMQRGAYTALVNWDPGDVLTLAAVPRLNFTRNITFSFLYLRVHHGADFVRPAESLPGDPAFVPADLEEGTEYTVRSLGFAARYSSTEWSGDRRDGIPVEVELRYRNTSKVEGGFVPKGDIWEVSVRLYRLLLGRNKS
ncbi:MAG: hypothetical protein GTO46_15440 [Gemmatimonadetes bacterium]|nr:hypothetical protein [Gemmatimonadota bacterium]NIO33030.1 hypothetical protein [Gemmatimonadota bacterium]